MASNTGALTQVNRLSEKDPSVLRTLMESIADGALPQSQALEQQISLRLLDAGEAVFMQGVVHPQLYAVRKGLIKLCYLGDDGSEWIKSFVPEGRFFASITALEPGGRTSFMATALEASVLERVDHGVLLDLATRHLPWSQSLRQLAMALAARKEQHEFELLALTPAQRYLAFVAANPDLEKRIPQKDLARHLGVTPVGLNRIVMRMRPKVPPPLAEGR